MKTVAKLVAGTALALVVAGCGPTTTNSNTTTPQPSAAGSWDGDLKAYAIQANAIKTMAGTADASDDSFSIGTMAGTHDRSTGIVALSGGGTITLNTTNYEVGLFIANAGGGSQMMGVVGNETASSALPSGTANYTGDAYVVVNDGSGLYELEGTAKTTLNFANSSGSTVINNLDGTRTDAFNATTTINDAATITFGSVSTSGGKLTANAASLSASKLASAASGQETVSLQGDVYGASGASVGGVFILDDTAQGSLLVQGAFIGD